MKKEGRVAIIGAGIGGLTAALVLTHRGYDVLMYDRLDRPGGKINVFEHDGQLWDTGPSVFTMQDVLQKIDAAAGSDLCDRIELIRHDQTFAYQFGDGTELPIYFELAKSITSVRDVFGSEAAAEFSNFLTYAGKIWRAAAPNFVYGAAPTYGSAILMGASNPFAIKAIDPLRTMNAAIERHVKSDHLRTLLKRFATYNGSDPRVAPATLNCIAHVELAMGCFGVRGGMYQLVTSFMDVLSKRQFELRPGTTVEKIVKKNGKFDVVTGSTVEEFDFVVSNVDAAHLYTDLLSTSKPSRKRDDTAMRSMSGWTGLYACAKKDRVPHTVIFPEQYDEEFVAIFDRREIPEQPTVYVSSQTHAHAKTSSHDILFVMINAPSGYAGDLSVVDSYMEDLLRRNNIVDEASERIWSRTPDELGHAFPGTNGAIYGAASNSQFSAFNRPKNRSTVDGLYLASGSAHPGGGVPMCMLSGLAAAGAALSDQ